LLTQRATPTYSAVEKLGLETNPIEALTHFLDAPYPTLLHSALVRPGLGRYSYVTADPFLVVRSKGRHVEILERGAIERLDDNPFAVVKRLLTEYQMERQPGGPPFQGGAIGYFGYELGQHLERLPSSAIDELKLPDLNVGFYDWVIAFDHVTQQSWIVTTEFSPDHRLDWIHDRIHDPHHVADPRNQHPMHATRLRSNFSRDEYLDAVRRVKKYIEDGDIYQANISQRFEIETDIDSWSLYQSLREASPAPYGAYLQFPELAVLSSSPEQFLLLDYGRVVTRPMKGTRPRGTSRANDAQLRDELSNSVKDRAENIMIVDLLRNDLGKVCVPGSIQVPELFTVEEYRKVHQMASSVTGQLRPEHDAIDLLTACFPGGSVTGAPKIRAMEIIDEIEPVQRSVYCGAIGYIGFDGSMQMSIPIRTMLMKGQQVYFQVGGGIVADSEPEAEYQETLDKALGSFEALGISGFQT
jgi:para-aminobenzoate synthetase component 1